jgi:hypothetical protein
VQSGAVDVRENGNGSNAHLAACPNDTNGDLAAIRYEDFGEHSRNLDCNNKILGLA